MPQSTLRAFFNSAMQFGEGEQIAVSKSRRKFEAVSRTAEWVAPAQERGTASHLCRVRPTCAVLTLCHRGWLCRMPVCC